MEQTAKTLDEAETRTRAVNRRLRGVETYLEKTPENKFTQTPQKWLTEK